VGTVLASSSTSKIERMAYYYASIAWSQIRSEFWVTYLFGTVVNRIMNVGKHCA